SDAVADGARAEGVDRSPDRFRPRVLTGVGNGSKALRASQLERGSVRLRRVLGFRPAEADADHATVAVLDRVADDVQCLVEAVHTRDVRRPADPDPLPPSGPLPALTNA